MRNLNTLRLSLFALLGLLLSIPTTSNAQASCASNTAITSIETNDVRVGLPGTGGLWWDGANAQYLVDDPNNPGQKVGTLFAGGLWLGGVDPGGNLKLASSTYGHFSGNDDYWPGPLSQGELATAENCGRYDRFWKVTQSDIRSLLDDLLDNGTLDNPIPDALKEWPANGNPYFEAALGFALPSSPQGMAPFFDQNNDGIYDPAKGDYPQIKGANQAVWWVFNDAGGIHTESGGDLLLVEVQAMAYTYEDAPAPMNRATFYDYRLINRAIEDVDSTYLGLWVDPDLGCYQDDFIGVDPDKNLFYVYNADALDGNQSCNDCNGVATFCEKIPVMSIKILKGTHRLDPTTGNLVDNGLSSLTYYDNPAYALPPAMNDPQTAVEFYNYMTGSWRDGTPLSYGGTGYNPTSTQTTKFAFSDAPNDPNGWSMCSENLGLGDRRVVMGSGPFTWRPGAVNSFSFVAFITDAVAHPCPDLSAVYENCALIDDFYDGLPTATHELATPEKGIQLFPNPMKEYSILKVTGRQIEQVELFASNGQLLRTYRGLNSQELKIDRKELAAGMYLYRLRTSEGQWFSGKMVVE